MITQQAKAMLRREKLQSAYSNLCMEKKTTVMGE
jgi:cell division protein FtsL